MEPEPKQFDLPKMQKGIGKAVWQAVVRHKKLGESVAVWRGERVVVLSAQDIPTPEDISTPKDDI